MLHNLSHWKHFHGRWDSEVITSTKDGHACYADYFLSNDTQNNFFTICYGNYMCLPFVWLYFHYKSSFKILPWNITFTYSTKSALNICHDRTIMMEVKIVWNRDTNDPLVVHIKYKTANSAPSPSLPPFFKQYYFIPQFPTMSYYTALLKAKNWSKTRNFGRIVKRIYFY